MIRVPAANKDIGFANLARHELVRKDAGVQGKGKGEGPRLEQPLLASVCVYFEAVHTERWDVLSPDSKSAFSTVWTLL